MLTKECTPLTHMYANGTLKKKRKKKTKGEWFKAVIKEYTKRLYILKYHCQEARKIKCKCAFKKKKKIPPYKRL